MPDIDDAFYKHLHSEMETLDSVRRSRNSDAELLRTVLTILDRDDAAIIRLKHVLKDHTERVLETLTKPL